MIITIGEAIYFLRGALTEEVPDSRSAHNDAIKLGIEALKEVKRHRKWPGSIPKPDLPGETKD